MRKGFICYMDEFRAGGVFALPTHRLVRHDDRLGLYLFLLGRLRRCQRRLGRNRLHVLSLTKIRCDALMGFRENCDKASGSSSRFVQRTLEPADERAQMQWMQAERSTKHHEHVPDIQAARRS
jgi:hypothetical protein